MAEKNNPEPPPPLPGSRVDLAANAKLGHDDVRHILANSETTSVSKLAELHGISRSAVRRVLGRKSYKGI